MADNFAFTAGAGSTGAADDIGGVLFPRVKLIYGVDGTNSGDVAAANPLPTTDASVLAAIQTASTVKTIVGTRTQLTTTALDSLASTAYVSAGTITPSTNDPVDVLVEVAVTPGTVAGSFRVQAFLKSSLDGTNFTTGPESGTTATDEPNLIALGTVPCNTNATLQRGVFSVKTALGYVPAAFKVIVKNETGASLAADGNDVNYSEVSGTLS